MKKIMKSTVAILLAVVIILSTYVPVIAEDNQPSKYSTQYNSGKRNVYCTTLDGTGASKYYTGNNTYEYISNKSSGSEILSSLSTLMRSTHTYLSSYDDCHYKANRTDCENENGSSNKLSLIYTSYTATQSQWNGWNREHVWPKSLGGDNTTGGGADMHHIRPSDATVNSTRGNSRYGNVVGGKSVYGSNPASGCLGGTSNSAYFEPLDNIKGDVARICLYVYVRWGSDWNATSITKVFQSVDVLLEWCKMDPVDTWEMGRNEVVGAIQGNRNVFIDYPEYAWLIFDREVPSDMVTPSGEAAKGSTTNPGGGNGGTTNPGGGSDTPVCTHNNTVIKNTVAASCFSNGYTGDTYCADCDKLISKGSAILAMNAHDFGDWELVNGSYVKHCSVCNESVPLSLDVLLATIDNDSEKMLILLTLGVSDSALFEALSN